MVTSSMLMVQGTASNAGKSLIVAGLCRLLANNNIKVAPFKPQNMSNNAMVSDDGGEIGRAQALQARACGEPTSVHMNPILLKPESQNGSQVIIQGEYYSHASAKEYYKLKNILLPKALQSFHHLQSLYDVVIIEGAGSPAEVNLRASDIANMGFAREVGAPVTLVGDIDKGGVIASIIGTYKVLDTQDKALLHSFIINRFRGDITLFDDATTYLEESTPMRQAGIVPFFDKARLLPEEDSVNMGYAIDEASHHTCRHIVIIILPHIANFDDVDSLKAHPSLRVSFIYPEHNIPHDADYVIIPGSKSTISDYQHLERTGMSDDIKRFAKKGGHVLGICGGYQMLGEYIEDKHGIEHGATYVETLGLLPIYTHMMPQKTLAKRHVHDALYDIELEGYEIHIGQSFLTNSHHKNYCQPLFHDMDITGAMATNNHKISGSYMHGLFDSAAYVSKFFGVGQHNNAQQHIDVVLDEFADHLYRHIDIQQLFPHLSIKHS